jgi:hypothetical protein
MSKIIILSLLFILPIDLHAKKNEKYYQTIHCNKLNGKIEYRLEDGTRIDCLTENKAIEYDWAKKWAECVGQSLYYAAKKEKGPGCALIGTKKELDKHSSKIKLISDHYNLNIKIFEIFHMIEK